MLINISQFITTFQVILVVLQHPQDFKYHEAKLRVLSSPYQSQCLAHGGA